MGEIENRLKSLRLPGMAECWSSWEETRSLDGLSLRDGLQLLLQAEEDNRKRNRDARLIKGAHFRYHSFLEELNYDSTRGLSKVEVMNLASGEYIRRGISVLITGPAGTGKSYLASALGHHACLTGFKVRYYGMQKLFEEITLCRMEATLHKFFDKMAQVDLLILDDWGLKKFDCQQVLDFMELIEDRHGRKSTILISQLPVSEFYTILEANTTAADAICDRIVHSSIRFSLSGESLRKK